MLTLAARQPDFRPPGESGLEQQAGGIGLCGLVHLQLMIRPLVAKQRSGRRDREAVVTIPRRVQAQTVNPVAADGEQHPP